MTAPLLVLGSADWLALLMQFMMLSLLSVGGAISTSPDMHRFLVQEHHYLSQVQFSESIALAQAAPGPNVLFVALMGWHVGMNTGSFSAAVLGVAITMGGILLPSTILTYNAARLAHRNRDLRAVRAFKLGMAPVVIALMFATSWILGSAAGRMDDWPLWLLAVISALVLWRTRLHILWVLAAGAVLGWLQLV
ncbi:chromate transporter [Massilia sp. PAMC28688]|uniref:chromate transporter n=1 Tax=Massilia sp. PAMC28688 TaxID=2861283 RepID=UPI001C639CC5|nr:chromate transporter [Massilia sp. PAMC28688]QYF92803.1 chromate transporter [Massilia sp. PAMC28688]